jgi:polyphosphate:AMP phosphotransferase
MFDSADLDHAIDKDTYEREVPALRAALLAAQQEAQAAKRFQVIILVGGVDGAGKGEIVNLLNEWMDPRHIHTHGMGAPTDEELARPPMWRFWRALPPKGQIGIFFGSWYTEPIVSRVKGKSSNGELVERLDEVVRFERMLTDEGALVLKFWLHLSKRDQRRRLEALQADPATRWRVSPIEWKHYRIYDKFRKVSERALRQTSTGPAPWIVVSGKDARYRAITVSTAILGALRRRLDEPEPARRVATPRVARAQERNLLRALDLRQTIDKAAYEEELEQLKGRLNLLTRDKRFRRMSVAGVFEGVDAAGKGGAIRRITAALDARYYHVHPIAAPTEEERAQPYLWRFWRNVPKDGAVALFDRSGSPSGLVEVRGGVSGLQREA